MADLKKFTTTLYIYISHDINTAPFPKNKTSVMLPLRGGTLTGTGKLVLDINIQNVVLYLLSKLIL